VSERPACVLVLEFWNDRLQSGRQRHDVTNVPELLADARALARAIELSSTEESRNLAAAVVANIDALSADSTELGSEESLASANALRALETVVSELVRLLHSKRSQWRDELVPVQVQITELLRVAQATIVGDAADAIDSSEVAGEVSDIIEDARCDEWELVNGEHDLQSAAEAHSFDARRQSRLALILYAAALGAAGVATVLAWQVIVRRGVGLESAPADIAAECIPVLAMLCVAVYIAQQASRCVKNSDELRRVRRQLATLNVYLEPLPHDTRDLLRAALIQRLFPRLLEDDPLREDDWFPDADTLLASINPRLLAQISSTRSELDHEENDEDEDEDEDADRD
jgi:hypothetical protein